jgi:hypothetical protein
MMRIIPTFRHLLFSGILFLFYPAYSQQKINFRDYFYPQNQLEYTLKYGHENDTTTLLFKTIKVSGRDTIEVADFGQNKEFYSSLKFVAKEADITVIQAKRSLNGRVFNSEISLSRWAQINPGKSNKVQFNVRTSDTCTFPLQNCYWEWIRHKQSGLKRGNMSWHGKFLKTISISFIEFSLYQPIVFSSISGLSTTIQTYVFAEGTGLIKIIATNKALKISNTLVLQN